MKKAKSILPRSVALTTVLGAAGSLAAQTAKPTTPATTPAEGSTTELKEVVVEGKAEPTYKPERLQSPKIQGPLRDVPQTVTVIPKTVIEDRGAFTLRDVLRNTPGVSMQAGEGGGGLPGDNLSIRGFSARTDIYIDGGRDYGAYSRDPFNLEQVEVAKGPASANNGRGSTGGSINLQSKQANLTRSFGMDTTVGTDELFRVTADVNQPIGDHMAFRMNGLYHTQDTPGRDVVDQERYGLAASLAFGLGTDTRLFLNYSHLTEHNTPDFGIPWVPARAAAGDTFPAEIAGYQNQPPPVDYDNFYGRRNVDYEDTQTDILTAILEHDFSDKVRLRNLFRYGRTERDSVITAPRFYDSQDGVGGTPNTPGSQYTRRVNRQLQRRMMTYEAITNLTNLTIEFDTGPLKHTIATGLELAWERQMNGNAARSPTNATANVFPGDRTDLFSPEPDGPSSPLPAPVMTEAHMDSIGLYLFDTIKIGKHWEISGGVRYDHIESDIRGAGGAQGFTNTDDLWSYKAAVVYKPVEYGSIYLGYGSSFNTSIDGNVGLALGGAAAGQTDPEEARTFELGTKWDLFEERLSLTAAIFQINRFNARTTPAVAGALPELGGDQQVRGLELGIAGSITKNWQVFAGYSYMESEIKASANVNEAGQALSNAPDHTFNIWTTYTLPANFQVGFGAQYVGDRTNGNTNTARTAPGYWTMDAMLSYKVSENVSLRLNVYNLADERYIDRVGGGHFVPGPGRSASLTASIKF